MASSLQQQGPNLVVDDRHHQHSSSPNNNNETQQTAIWGPKMVTLTKTSPDALETSVHTLPKPLRREFHHVFPENSVNLEDLKMKDRAAEILAIPTNQWAREDLVAIGDKIEAEKDRLLNVFIAFARNVCETIRKAGYWADFIDPCSGLPMLTLDCNKVYSEVDGMECCLQYKSYSAGFCKILMHPRWGSAVYPATIFVCAPRAVVVACMAEYPVANAEK